MKNILTILIFVLLNFTINAQDDEKSTLTVYGVYDAQTELEEAVLIVQLSAIEASPYNNIKGQTLETVEENFRKAVKEAKLSEQSLQSNTVMDMRTSYGSYSYQKFLIFKTPSEEAFMKIIDLEVLGVAFHDFKLVPKKIGNEQEATFFNEALKDAKTIAQSIAKKNKQQLGKVIDAETMTVPQSDDWSYSFVTKALDKGSFDFTFQYIVKVTYALE